MLLQNNIIDKIEKVVSNSKNNTNKWFMSETILNEMSHSEQAALILKVIKVLFLELPVGNVPHNKQFLCN